MRISRPAKRLGSGSWPVGLRGVKILKTRTRKDPEATKSGGPDTHLRNQNGLEIEMKPTMNKKRKPAKTDPRMQEIYKDSDGWWVILADGWTIGDSVGCREDTKAALLKRIKSAKQTGILQQ